MKNYSEGNNYPDPIENKEQQTVSVVVICSAESMPINFFINIKLRCSNDGVKENTPI
jgi:hypothetical protein